MKILQTALLSSLMFCAAQANTLLLSDLPWGEQLEMLKKNNDGHDLLDPQGPFFTAMHTHAHEIATELLYLVDHAQPKVHAAYYEALVALLDNLGQTLENHQCKTTQTAEEFLNNPTRKQIIAHITAFWAATRHYLQQTITPEACPFLHQALAYLDLCEQNFEEFNAQQEKAAREDGTTAVDFSPLDEQAKLAAVEGLASCKYCVHAGYLYLQTEEHALLLKQLILAWVGLVQEKAFFESLQTKSFPTDIPEPVLHFAAALNCYGQAFQDAINPFAAADDLAEYADEAAAFVDLEEDDCFECDFNAQFKKRNAR